MSGNQVLRLPVAFEGEPVDPPMTAARFDLAIRMVREITG